MVVFCCNFYRTHYAPGINRILCLDALGNEISVLDMECNLDPRFNPKNNKKARSIQPRIDQKEVRETIIMGFAWSEQQRRIGCCMKDFTMSFWDEADGFKLEKHFLTSTQSEVSDFQSKIWFVDYLNTWITTDLSTNNLYSWDIEKECLIKKLEQPLDEDGKVGEIGRAHV